MRRSPPNRLVLAAAPLAALAACAEPSIQVTVTARPAVQDVAAIDAVVRDPDGDEASVHFALDGRLPRSFVVATAGREAPIAIEVTGIDGDGAVVAAGATTAGVSAEVTVALAPVDFVVNTTIYGWQATSSDAAEARRSLIVADDGGFLIAFVSGFDIVGRLFDAAARPRRSAAGHDRDFAIDTAIHGHTAPSLATRGDRHLAAWNRDGSVSLDPAVTMIGILGSDGALVAPASRVGPDDGMPRWRPVVAAEGDGWAVAYEVTESFLVDGQLRLTRIDRDGRAGGEVRIGDIAGGHGGAALAGGDAGLAVAWVDLSGVLRVQIFDHDAAAASAQVPSSTMPRDPRLASSSSGDGYWLAWHDADDADGPAVKLARLSGRGAVVGSPVVAARLLSVLDFGGCPGACPDLAVRADGALAVVWVDQRDGREGSDVFLRLARPDGTPCGAPVRVNTTVNGDQSRPAVAAFGDDAFVVAWTDHSGGPPDASASDVRARVFYADLEGCR